MGNALKDLGKLERAIVSCSKAPLQTDYAEAFYNMGKAYADQDNLKRRWLQKAIKLGQDMLQPQQHWKSFKIWAARCNIFCKAIYIDPEHAKTYKNLANVMSEQGKVEEALSYYKKALEIEPNYAEVTEI